MADFHEYLREINNPETAVIFDCWYNYAYAEKLGYRLSRAYYDSTISLVRRKNQNHPYQSIAALKDEALLERFLQKERTRGIAVVFFDRLDRAVEAVRSGRQDALLVTTATAEWILRHDERNAFAAEVIPGISGEYAVGIRSRENKLFRAIVSKAADSLSIEEKANVRGKYSYPPERTLSLIGFFYRNPLMAALFPAGLLFLLSLVFGIIIFTRRRDLRNAAIIRKLPVKYVVADRNGAILYHISSDAGGGTAHFRQLQGKVSSFDDFLPPEPAGRMRRAVAGVIDTGFPAQLDFPCEGRKWSAGVVKLPSDLFGVDAAVWVLQDTTELQDARDRLQERAMLMDAAAQIGSMTYFVIDAGDINVKLFPDPRFWPVENDRPIAHRKWLAPEDLEPRLSEWRHFLESKMRSIRFQYRAGFRRDAMRYYELNATKTELAGSKEIEIIGNIRDITAEKRHELEREAINRTLQRQLEKLRQAQRERALILNNIHIPIALHDRTGKLLHVNSAAGEMTGKTIRELEETAPFAIFRAEDDTTESSPLHRVIATGKPASAELRIGGRDYLVRAEPITDELEEMVNIVQSAVDVTEIEEAKKQQEAALKAAIAADQAKNYFLATMSHEIRTPLNAVLGFTELLRTGDFSPAEQREYLEAINRSGNALLALINDVLDLSKLEAGQLEIDPAPVDPVTLLEDIRTIFAVKAKEKGLSFTISGSEGVPELYLDAARMRQILLNLVGNAVKFTHRGGITLKIDFTRLDPESGTLTIEVIDTGIGISDAFRARLFLPFTQQDSVRGNRKYGGTGLGLTITKRLLERMGGSLECCSAEGQGSTFTVRLEHVRCAAASATAAQSTKPPAKPARSHQILLVDDVPANLRVLEALLKRLGQQPVSTLSPKQALQLFRCGNFDLVMTDLWMPEMNGAELAEILRAEAPGIRLVAVTADTEAESNFNMKLFDAVLTKPVTANKVKAVLEQLENRITPSP